VLTTLLFVNVVTVLKAANGVPPALICFLLKTPMK
jgi:hypothetical protein